MARRRYKKRRMRKKGIMHDLSLYFKSPARRKGMIAGLVLAPAITLWSQHGRDAYGWLTQQYSKLAGK